MSKEITLHGTKETEWRVSIPMQKGWSERKKKNQWTWFFFYLTGASTISYQNADDESGESAKITIGDLVIEFEDDEIEVENFNDKA